VYEARWFPAVATGRVSIDPTRMAQGIMTGIGFLGAGTIMRDGLSVRGLTTAASIWITAAMGVLLGIGFYFPAALALILTLATLSVLRRIESRMPTQVFAHCYVRFERGRESSEDRLRELAAARGFTVTRVGYRLEGTYVEYQLWLRGRAAAHSRDLIAAFGALPAILELRLIPTGD
jgi:putative Mg2+ transporter-C (MgtC) family protein